jgi:hypothetical protein
MHRHLPGRSVAAIAATALLTALLAGCNLGAPQASPDATAASVLLVAAAESGTFEQAGNNYSLTLTGVDPQVTWFTDRPVRRAGAMEVQPALDGLFAAGAAGPPNAALSVTDPASARVQVAVVELTDPDYDAAAGTLGFSARLLDQPTHGLDYYAARADTIPAAFGQAELFIDNVFGLNYCGGTITNNSSQVLNLNGYPDMNGYWEYELDGGAQSAPQQIGANGSASFMAEGPGPGDLCNLIISYQTADGTAGLGLQVTSPASGDNRASVSATGTGCSATVELNSTSGSTASGAVTFTCP